jgi:hypothetical protein
MSGGDAYGVINPDLRLAHALTGDRPFAEYRLD